MRGGEKCLEALCELFPAAPIYTLFYEKGRVSQTISGHPVRTSFLQSFPGIRQSYRYYLPFFSSAMQSFETPDCELVISMSHCVAKGIRKRPRSKHLCYCFTPVRYAWGLFEEYFGDKNPLFKNTAGFFLDRLKDWDLAVNARVDHFVAISDHVGKRIRDFYGRQAQVIYPPVDTDFFTPDGRPREEAYLIVSALVPYKRIDVAIEAFNRLKRKLWVIGSGPEEARLRSLAGDSIEFLGWRSDAEIRDAYRRARALVFPGEEDFGIVPVEAQASGLPVIAFKKGGALETIEDGVGGLFFEPCTSQALEQAVLSFEKMSFDAERMRQRAMRFGRERFKKEMREVISELVNK